MVQIIEGKGGPAAIGGGFGRGLADQLPQEVDRYRLKQGLKQFEQESGNLNPMQQIARLASIPGITPQMIQTMGELAKMQNIKSAGPASLSGKQTPRNDSIIENKPDNASVNNTARSNNSLPEENKPDKKNTLTSPEDVQRNRFPTMTESEKEQRAFEYWDKNPGRFPGGLQDARQKVEQELSEQQNLFRAKEQKRTNDIQLEDKTLSDFRGRINGDIPTQILQNYEDKALEAVNSGKTPEKASKEIAAQANEFIKERDKLKVLGGNVLTRAPKDLVNDLKQFRESYEKNDALDVFVEDMKQFNGLGDHLASSIGYPISDSLNKSIPKFSEINKKLFNTDKAVNEMAKNFTDKDSFYSLGLALEEDGYNSDEMMKKFLNLFKDNKLPLTPIQQRELESYAPLNYTLGDIFFSHFTDLIGGSTKLPAKEKIRRTWYKKR